MAGIEKMLETQISLSEWLQRIGHKDAKLLNREDNDKRERLDVLNKLIGLPFDKPTKFSAEEIRDRVPRLMKFVEDHGEEHCALRLMPISGEEHLPKLRMRGQTVKEVLNWFDKQKIDDYSKYKADFMPHTADNRWATIFVVNSHGVFGEIYYGGHHILTQGFHEEGSEAPATFTWDFKDGWVIEPENKDALEHLKDLLSMIKVEDKALQQRLADELQATFTSNYLNGYFETVDSSDMGIWYVDYNRVLGEYLEDFDISLKEENTTNVLVRGRSASPGVAKGIAYIVDDPESGDFEENGILVCKMTSPDYLPLMQKAAAIVTDEGGILCHAAIVARELGKPCIVSTGDATTKIQKDQKVTVDATKGTVTVA